MTLVLLIVVASSEAALLGVVGGLWLRGRRRQRLLRAKLTALQTTGPPRNPRSRRLVPTGQEAVKAMWETAALVRERGFGGALRTSIEDLSGWAQVERPDLVRLAGADGSVAILFSDIEGSTALNEKLGDKQWMRLLESHNRVVRMRIERESGHVIKTQGDGFMVAFGSAEQAVRCAISVQQAFDRGHRMGRPSVLVRIGIHQGDVVHRDGDIFGRNVAQAARIAALAGGGEILLSESVAVAIEPLEDIALHEPRPVELKGLTGHHLVTAVDWAA